MTGAAGRFWHNARFTNRQVVRASRPATDRLPLESTARTGSRTDPEVRMKKDIHPAYREVAFVDLSNDFKFITRSTVAAREKITIDGK